MKEAMKQDQLVKSEEHCDIGGAIGAEEGQIDWNGQSEQALKLCC